MAGDTLGKLFKIQSWGESHGPAIGVTLEGCPPGIEIDIDAIQEQLNRRRPGQSTITTARSEKDAVKILSGLYAGKSTGTPIAMLIENKDQRSKDYNTMNLAYRPSHADYTYEKKYGIRDPNGGGRSSARITAGAVAAGAIAKKVLQHFMPAQTLALTAFVRQVESIQTDIKVEDVDPAVIESNAVRCPDPIIAQKMQDRIVQVKKQGDSLGGIIECIVKHVPVGWGEPVFDKLEADLAKAMLSINACKGFDIGSGFSAISMKGSEHNDVFYKHDQKIMTQSNYSGGVQGGISNGMPIVFRCAFKPTATILKDQNTLSCDGEKTVLKSKGRHDPCVLPRAVPIVEAMTYLTLCDHFLRHRAQCG